MGKTIQFKPPSLVVIASLNAQRNLSTTQETLSRSIQRLSSGLRVNSARDDAAGLAIAEKEVQPNQIGGSPRHLPALVLGVVRDGELLRIDDPRADAMEAGDRLLFIRTSADDDD